jgi:hypothetical protein
MSTVAGITCTFVRGDAPAPKQRVQLWQMPGVDGFGAQTLGLGDSEFQFTAVFYGTRSAVGAWAASIQALQGRLAVVVNDWGTSYPRCLICKISVPKYSPAAFQGGARGEIVLEGVVCP